MWALLNRPVLKHANFQQENGENTRLADQVDVGRNKPA
jgi:hypothetical protein